MSDSRQEIPMWSWYNVQFLFQFEDQLESNPNQTITQFFNDFLINQGMQNLNIYHTKNQGTVILLMYGLLVIPREIWEKTTTDFTFKTRDSFSVKIPSDGNDLDTFEFIKRLRNSLLQANFSLDLQNAILTFWNNNSKGERTFEVEISYSDLGKFLVEAGNYCNDVRNTQH